MTGLPRSCRCPFSLSVCTSPPTWRLVKPDLRTHRPCRQTSPRGLSPPRRRCSPRSRSGSDKGAVPVRRTAEDADGRTFRAASSSVRAAPGGSDAAAAHRRHGAPLDRAQSGRLSEGRRHHARRRSAPKERHGGRGPVAPRLAVRRPEGRARTGRTWRRARWSGARRVRRRRVLPRVRRHALGDRAVDDPVRRSPPRDQSDARGQSRRPSRRASQARSRRASRSKAGRSVRSATRTTRRSR